MKQNSFNNDNFYIQLKFCIKLCEPGRKVLILFRDEVISGSFKYMLDF